MVHDRSTVAPMAVTPASRARGSACPILEQRVAAGEDPVRGVAAQGSVEDSRERMASRLSSSVLGRTPSARALAASQDISALRPLRLHRLCFRMS